MPTPGLQNVNDMSSFAELRGAARRNEPEALRAAAQQFEALLTQQMLKSARAAKLGDDMLGSSQTEFYQEMFDKQVAMKLAEGRGMGLADVLVRQLKGQNTSTPVAPGTPPVPMALKDPTASPMPLALNAPASMKKLVFHPERAYQAVARMETPITQASARSMDFVNRMLPHAEAAARELGVPAHVLVAQAALETGWGKHQIMKADGTPSYNFFGIKADRGWDGDRVSRMTTEYEQGVSSRQRAEFRSYDSPEAAFKDYVAFLKTQPRYREALNHNGDTAAFVQGLQKAGYATDPQYADKISRIASGRLMTLALAAQPTPHQYTV